VGPRPVCLHTRNHLMIYWLSRPLHRLNVLLTMHHNVSVQQDQQYITMYQYNRTNSTSQCISTTGPTVHHNISVQQDQQYITIYQYNRTNSTSQYISTTEPTVHHNISVQQDQQYITIYQYNRTNSTSQCISTTGPTGCTVCLQFIAINSLYMLPAFI
jgi:hypothetical protein